MSENAANVTNKNSAADANKNWDLVITAKRGWFDLHLQDLWRYRDLIWLFVRRDFVANYVQTILGPLWFIAQPLFSAIIYTVIFTKVARIPTDGLPPFLFYMAGSVVWGYFSNCFQNTSNTLTANVGIFGKVYFPRLSVPLATVISSLGKFGLNFILFSGFLLYFTLLAETSVQPNWYICLLPVLILQMALLGLGCGILVSALSSKYRDLTYMMGFTIQLWMYATPIVYPASLVPSHFRAYYMLNPMVSIVEIFRLAFLGASSVTMNDVLLSWFVTLAILFIGVIVFNRIERNFIDTV